MGGGAGIARHQWLLIVVVAAGLVGMHHLVHAHAEDPIVMASATHIGLADVDPVAAKSTAVMAAPADCCDHHMDLVGHLCLAVLTAFTSLTAALIFAAARAQPLEAGHVLAAVRAVAARAPPADGARFTRLCVLRH
ncbi:MAG: DUF6153 family protein [Pseudonocardiaceae bacterium]